MRVLVALDDAPVSARAARTAARLFAGQQDVEFLVMNVSPVSVSWIGAADYGVVSPMLMDSRWFEANPAEDDDHEHALMAEAAAAGITHAEVMTPSGDPVAQICAAAETHAVDVIVVGSHDKSALRRLFDPSVASGVVRHTSLPVVVVSGAPEHR